MAELMAVRADRMTLVRGILDGLEEGELARPGTRAPAPGRPVETRSVGDCLRVVREEECEHHRFAVPDVAVRSSQHHQGSQQSVGSAI
jgi:hypothetical protein